MGTYSEEGQTVSAQVPKAPMRQNLTVQVCMGSNANCPLSPDTQFLAKRKNPHAGDGPSSITTHWPVSGTAVYSQHRFPNVTYDSGHDAESEWKAVGNSELASKVLSLNSHQN
jgi:hypothetical protein